MSGETESEKDQRVEDGRYAFFAMLGGFSKVTASLETLAGQINGLSAQNKALAQQVSLLERVSRDQIEHLAALQTQIGVLVNVLAARSGLEVYPVAPPSVQPRNGFGQLPMMGGGATPYR